MAGLPRSKALVLQAFPTHKLAPDAAWGGNGMSSGSNKLLRVLGLAFGLAAVVGSIIGQGILRTPGVVAQATESPALIIALWAGGALVAVISAFAIAELAAAMPRAGGAYTYIYRAYGARAGLLAAFTLLLTYLASIAMYCFIVGEYLVRLGVGGGEYSPVVLGLGVAVLFAILNSFGTKGTGASQIFFSAFKGMALIGVVIALFASPGVASPPAADAKLLAAGWLPLGTAMVAVIGAYNGWWDVVFYGEEIEDPAKQVPRALFGGIIAVALLYLLINLAMLHVLTPVQMAGSNLVAADATRVAFGENGDLVVTLLAILSVAAIGNLVVMTTTRIVYALARAQILPQVLTKVDKRGTPIFAMLFTVIVGVSFIVTGSYNSMLSLGVTVNQGINVLAILAVFGLRKREPDLERPFKIPWYPWPAVIASVVNIALLAVFIVQDPFYSLSGLVLVGAFWVLYVFGLKRTGVLEPIEEET